MNLVETPNEPFQLRHLTPKQFFKLIKMHDPYGRPWCMLTFFYSPDCVFSAKAAKMIYQIAPYFPKLRVVAVNVSLHNYAVDE